MTKKFGLARFSIKGPMEYLLTSGAWMQDAELYSGAPILLFEHRREALDHAQRFHLSGSCVEFSVDRQGQVLAI